MATIAHSTTQPSPVNPCWLSIYVVLSASTHTTHIDAISWYAQA